MSCIIGRLDEQTILPSLSSPTALRLRFGVVSLVMQWRHLANVVELKVAKDAHSLCAKNMKNVYNPLSCIIGGLDGCVTSMDVCVCLLGTQFCCYY